MEISRNMLLVFPQEIMYKPLIYRLVREFDLVFNLLEAKILPRREGRIIVELRGPKEAVTAGIDFLEAEGVEIKTIAEQIERDEEKCVHCGACTAVCRVGALAIDRESMEVLFHADKCVACGQCETACPMRALCGVNIERLGKIVA
jgi:ferredoxin